MLKHKESISYFFFYTLSFWLPLICQGVYWDDWVIYHTTPDWRASIYNESARPIYGMLYNFLFSFTEEVYFAKIFSFVAFFIPMLVVNSLLKKISEIEKHERIILVLIFGVFPVNFARASITITQYAFSYGLFFIAFGLVNKYLTSRNILFRVLSLVSFYIAFNMDSLLVFYLLVMFYIWCHHKKEIHSFFDVVKVSFRYVDYLILPVFFFVIKSIYFKPNGLYKDYNQVSVKGILGTPLDIYPSLRQSFFETIIESLSLFFQNLPIAIIFTIIIFLFLRSFFSESFHENSLKKNRRCLFFGFILFVLAVFPYNVVGHIPKPTFWYSRHQVLVPLGASFLVYFGVEILLSKINSYIERSKKRKLSSNARPLVYSVLLGSFLVSNNYTYTLYVRDWHKQLSVLEQFKESDVISENTSFLMKDHTRYLNANRRIFRFYEYTGLLKLAFNEETKFASDNVESLESLAKMKPYDYYNFKDFNIIGPQYEVHIKLANDEPSKIGTLKALLHKYIDREKYQEHIKGIIKLEYLPFKAE